MPEVFDAAQSIERIRVAQQQAAEQQAAAQQQQGQFADQVLEATGQFAADREAEANAAAAAQGNRLLHAGQFDSVAGPGESPVNPLEMGAFHGNGHPFLPPEHFEAWRAPGALTKAQKDTRAGVRGYRNLQAGRFDNVQGDGRANFNPLAMNRQSQQEPLNPEFEPWRSPGALTQDQFASQLARQTELDPTSMLPQEPELPMGASIDVGDARRSKDKAAGDAVVQDQRQAQGNSFPVGTAPNPVAPRMELPPEIPNASNASGGRRAAATAQRERQAGRKGPGGGWADPAGTKPLPGEETLPPTVAEWSQQNGGSTAKLERAYQIESDAGLIGDMHFGEWLQHKGLKPNMRPEEAGAKMDEIVAESLINHPDGDPLGRGWKDNRVNEDDDSILAGRKGVPDGIPLDLMTPEQKAKIAYDVDGTPRTARGGYYVWDQTAGENGAYVPRGMTQDNMAAARKAQAEGNYRKEAMLYGIDIHAYGDNDAMLKADVARERKRHERMASSGYEASDVAGGGTRYKPGAELRYKEDMRNRDQSIRTLTKRWAKEMKDSGVSGKDLENLYMSAYQRAAQAGHQNPHAAAMQELNSEQLNGFRLRKEQNVALAVQQDRDQYNRSVRFGIPKAIVTGLDGVSSATTAQDKANAFMVMHAQQPMMGWDKMAAMLVRGDMDAAALDRWIAGTVGQAKDPGKKHRENINSVSSKPVGDTTFAEWGTLAQQQLGPGAKPEHVRALHVQIAQPQAAEIVQRNGQPTPEEINYVRQCTSDMDYTTFCHYTGINAKDPASRAKYTNITGKPPGIQLPTFSDVVGFFSGGAGNTAQASPNPAK
jgi:hypothetical protein